MRKLVIFLSLLVSVLFLCSSASAILIDFESDTLGAVANGWMSDDSDLVTFTDSNGADLVLANYGVQGDGVALGCNTDYDNSELILTFALDVNALSFDFGNDDPYWYSEGYVEVELFNDGALINTLTMAMNLDDIMNQTFAYNGAAFDVATIEYLGTPIMTQDNTLIEVIDNINFEAAPVPEPATMLLLGTGLIGLAVGSRKKLFKK